MLRALIKHQFIFVFIIIICVNLNHLIGRCCTKQLCPKSPWVYA
jgi:hypothetical protein